MLNVLLVDDEIFARKGLRNLIDWEACGFQVVEEADNGEEALQLIQDIKPDLVVTDIRMPVLDGLELIERTMRSEIEKPSFIIISGYDDFNYAQQAVRYGVFDYLLKPIDDEELQDTLNRLAHKLQQERLIRNRGEHLLDDLSMEAIIKGEIQDQALQEWARRWGMIDGAEVFYAFVEINDVHPWRHDDLKFEPTWTELKAHVQEAISALMRKDHPTYIHEHRNRIGLLLSNEALRPFFGKVQLFARELQQTLAKRMNLNVFVYIGQTVSELKEIGESYRAAKEALQYKFIEDTSKVIIYDQIKGLPLNYIELDKELFNRFIESVEEQNLNVLEQTIDEIFREFQAKYYAPEAVKSTIHRCVFRTIQLINTFEADERELRSLEPMLSWQDLNISLAELKRLLRSFIAESAVFIAKHRKEYIKGGIQQIKTYIENHYAESISLRSIASKFYMNPVYLGQLFRKTYGVYFNEFLLKIRIQEAKRLLRQTDLRIYEVAEKIGFSNADYFVTQFEKLENMTPTEYRTLLFDKEK